MDTVDLILAEKGNVVRCIEKDKNVSDAAKEIARHNVGALVILKGQIPIGILSERDIVTRVVAKGLDAAGTKIEEVMTKNLVIITKETPIKEAMAIMTNKRCRHLPVMDEEKLAGLVSIGDLNRWYSRDYECTIRFLNDYIGGSYPV